MAASRLRLPRELRADSISDDGRGGVAQGDGGHEQPRTLESPRGPVRVGFGALSLGFRV